MLRTRQVGGGCVIRGTATLMPVLTAIVLLCAACGNDAEMVGGDAASGRGEYADPDEGQSHALITREQFMTAMPGLFLSTAGPVSLRDARRAYQGCSNRSAGILGGARFDERFTAEEVTNNQPVADGIGAVIDARWTAPRPYSVRRQMRTCSRAFETRRSHGIAWTVVPVDGSDLWAASTAHGRSIRLLLVASSRNGRAPDEKALTSLQRVWLR